MPSTGFPKQSLAQVRQVVYEGTDLLVAEEPTGDLKVVHESGAKYSSDGGLQCRQKTPKKTSLPLQREKARLSIQL